ncbi:8-amino-7-oxononanoate synthase [Moniliophthora roreri]|nr:8-amino-7-oxononanoate synthase [Moniliophthora roreri]
MSQILPRPFLVCFKIVWKSRRSLSAIQTPNRNLTTGVVFKMHCAVFCSSKFLMSGKTTNDTSPDPFLVAPCLRNIL